MATIEQFATKLEADQRRGYAERFGTQYPDLMEKASFVTVKPAVKYTKVDVGRSGKYMVVNATGQIYGIKAYGVIHLGHAFGTLDTIDEWDWSEYRAVRKS